MKRRSLLRSILGLFSAPVVGQLRFARKPPTKSEAFTALARAAMRTRKKHFERLFNVTFSGKK